MSAAPISLKNPPKTPRKESRKQDYRLGWWNQSDLSIVFEVERRREQLREAEKALYERWRREAEEILHASSDYERWQREAEDSLHDPGCETSV